MSAVLERTGYAVPEALRGARFIRRWTAGSPIPAYLPASEFIKAGLPVPEVPGQRNDYQLTRGQGHPWSAAIDDHVRNRGGELIGCGQLVCLDVDEPAEGPSTRAWLASMAGAVGGKLEFDRTVCVRTPGHRNRGHAPGWHCWYRLARPVRLGPLAINGSIELKARATAPGSPGYRIVNVTAGLPALPGWLAVLAGPPPEPKAQTTVRRTGNPATRLERLLAELAGMKADERKGRVYMAFRTAVTMRELIQAGVITRGEAEERVMDACISNGAVHDHGERHMLHQIRRGLAYTGKKAQA